jgi:hypothetical protein
MIQALGPVLCDCNGCRIQLNLIGQTILVTYAGKQLSYAAKDV